MAVNSPGSYRVTREEEKRLRWEGFAENESFKLWSEWVRELGMERVVSRSQKNSNVFIIQYFAFAAARLGLRWYSGTGQLARQFEVFSQYATTVALKHQQGHIMRQHLLNAAEPGWVPITGVLGQLSTSKRRTWPCEHFELRGNRKISLRSDKA